MTRNDEAVTWVSREGNGVLSSHLGVLGQQELHEFRFVHPTAVCDGKGPPKRQGSDNRLQIRQTRAVLGAWGELADHVAWKRALFPFSSVSIRVVAPLDRRSL